MISRHSVEYQLKKIGYNYSLWGRGEVAQLPSLLMKKEVIVHCVNGRYRAGFAMLCVTNQRVLLIDQKPLRFLAVEDLCYDRITQISFDYHLFDASIHFYTNNTQALDFSSWNKQNLRKLLNYVQERVAELHWREEQQQYRFEQIEQNVLTNHGTYSLEPSDSQGLPYNNTGLVVDNLRSTDKVNRNRVIKFIVSSVLQPQSAS